MNNETKGWILLLTTFILAGALFVGIPMIYPGLMEMPLRPIYQF